MDRQFFEELELPQPKYSLDVGSGSHGTMTGKMLAELETVLLEERPGVVLVPSNTNTVLADCLSAAKLHIPVRHVEAGQRSYDRSMPEELNRIVVDHISDYLFAPMELSQKIRLGEGIEEGKITVTGNTIIDVLNHLKDIGKISESRLSPLGLEPDSCILVTAHRVGNVDTFESLSKLIASSKAAADQLNLKAYYPCHPRTQDRLNKFCILLPDRIIIIADPVGIFDFMSLELHARIILTDSGSVQEEACGFQVPCVTLRASTERPETVQVGANLLACIEPQAVLTAVETMLSKPTDWHNPFGDGSAGVQIARIADQSMRSSSNGCEFYS